MAAPPCGAAKRTRRRRDRPPAPALAALDPADPPRGGDRGAGRLGPGHGRRREPVPAALQPARAGRPAVTAGRARVLPPAGPARSRRVHAAPGVQPRAGRPGGVLLRRRHAGPGDRRQHDRRRRPEPAPVVVIAVSLHQLDATQKTLLGIDAAVLALMLLLLGLVAASAVRLGLAPLTAMQGTAQHIAAGDLSRRVEDVDPHTEAGRLGIAFNAMLARIEAALAARTASEQRLRQFLADASHELRTPLTSIQGFAELYRRGGAPPGPALDEAMARIEAEADRMALLVTDLMLLARLDRERPLERHPVDLLSICADAVRDAHARLPARFVTLACDDPATSGDPGPVMVAGDEARLRQVVNNLVANALQHTPVDTKITLRVGRAAAADDVEPATATVGTGPAPDTPTGVLEVTDTGPGLPAGQAERVFERLYRADASRQRASGGAGLGLAIVAAIVIAHGGGVELRTRPGAGAAFRVLLPALPDPPAED